MVEFMRVHLVSNLEEPCQYLHAQIYMYIYIHYTYVYHIKDAQSYSLRTKDRQIVELFYHLFCTCIMITTWQYMCVARVYSRTVM